MKKLIKFLLSISIGVLYGLFFAQRSGKQLRRKLATSKNPMMDLFQELKSVDMEMLGMVKEWAQNSEDLRRVMDSGKEQFDALVKGVKELGDDATDMAQKELKKLEKYAKDAADELGKTAAKKVSTAKKAVTKKAKTVQKAATKKAAAVKKTAAKKVSKLKK